ncbi:MAG: prepilin peptidase [Fusobacterium sp.]
MTMVIDVLFVIDLILICYIDSKKYIIPNILNLGIIFLKFIKIMFFNFSFEISYIGMGVYPIILLFIYGYISDFYNMELIGFGDVKLMASIGFYNGYNSIFEVMTYYNIISIMGILIYLIIRKTKLKKDLVEKKLAFAPTIILAYFILKISERVI